MTRWEGILFYSPLLLNSFFQAGDGFFPELVSHRGRTGEELEGCTANNDQGGGQKDG
jgi:hypothetical protein